MTQLIGLTGKKGSGKDTIAIKLKEYGYEQYAFADPLKRGIQHLFDLSDEQLYDETLKETIDPRWGVKPRQLFQIIGTEIFQHTIHQHLGLKIAPKQHWTFLFEEWYRKKLQENPKVKVVVSDVRFLHELECVKALGGKVIKITRPEVYHNIDKHSSETSINQMSPKKIDYLIENDGTLDDLYQNLVKVLNNFV
jgi:dephospho-CoA kinase